VTDPALSLTYDHLDARANALARRLQTLGVGPGVRVGVCHDRAAINVVGLLAILKAGGAYVAMDPGHPEARLRFILRDAEVPVLLADRATIELLGSTSAELLDLEREQVLLEPSGDVVETLVDADDPAYVIYTSGSTGAPKGVQVSHGNLLGLVDWHHQAFGVGPTDRASVVANPAFDASVWELWPYLTVGAQLHISRVEHRRDARAIA
jgi:non-ribosomal peptide synthetase component F